MSFFPLWLKTKKQLDETMVGLLDAGQPLFIKSKKVTKVTRLFSGWYHITGIDLPNVTELDTKFEHCGLLTSVSLPKITIVPAECFSSCSMLSSVYFPSAEGVGQRAFAYCDSLSTVDLPNVKEIDNAAFYACSALTALILRTTETPCMAELTAFTGTPIVEGTGHIYVPASMYEQYRIYEQVLEPGFFDILFRKIEDYPEICGAS